MQALEAIQPNFVRQPAGQARSPWALLGVAAVLLAAVGVVFASTAPDGIEKPDAHIRLPMPHASSGWLG